MPPIYDSLKDYRVKRQLLVAQLKSRAHESSVSLQKSTSNLFRERQPTSSRLDVRGLNRVIKVDAKNLVAEVEGMTTYETLVAATLAHGCLPTVVPELNTITIGGAVAGGGIESSSFNYGFVHETVLEMEVLLSTGEVVVATPKQRPDLFYGLPNTFGTLGYVLKVKISLVRAKPFVYLRHIPFNDPRDFFSAISQIARTKSYNGETVDFMDGSVFAKGMHFLTLGTMVDAAPYTSNYTHMKIYYRSIQARPEDYLTTEDYIWRWDTDWFWCSDRFGADKWLVRLLLGKWLLHSRSYWKIVSWDRTYHLAARWNRLVGKSNKREPVIQDVQVPVDEAPKFLEFLHDSIGILPIWVCPTQAYDKRRNYTFWPLDRRKLYINFGFWDFVNSDHDPAEGYHNRLMERQLAKVGGTKGLYSDAFYTEKQFWELYDKRAYDALKRAYDPDGRFKGLYEKTVKRG